MIIHLARAALAALLLLSWMGTSLAGFNTFLTSSGGGGGGYTGPIDVVASPTAIYALRAASAAIAAAGTQKIVNVEASGTTPANVTCDILVTSSGGLGNTANCSTGSYNGTAGATFCATGAGSCNVETWYDQSGNGYNQSINTGTVALTFSCIGSLPCLTFNGSGYLCNLSFPTIAQPLTVSLSFSATATNTNYGIWGSNSNLIYEDFNTSATSGYASYFAGTGVFFGGGTIASGLHTFIAVFNSTSSAHDFDGAQTTGESAGTNGTGGSYLCIGNGNSVNYTGKIEELDVHPIAFSTGQMTSMNANISGYW